MTEWFDRFNHDYFDNRMPRPRLGLSRGRTRLGYMSYKKKVRWGRRPNAESYTICLSTCYDLPERQLQSVLLHEMIHYWIALQGWHDTAPHGRIFHEYMNRFNALGWQISVTAHLHGNATPACPRHHDALYILLFVRLRTGRNLFTVVNPRYAPQLEMLIRRAPTVAAHEWRVSEDASFGNYMQVRSLRGMAVSAARMEELKGKSRPINDFG